MMNFDFKNIRPIRNSANNGFEELCCQLAAHEPAPPGSRFIRNGTPDGGVEAYWLYGTGTERGWQAKYFDELKSPQWRQLDKSVETALSTHPNLTYYTLCLPLDLPDSREQGKKSLRQKWDERVTKWRRVAAGKGMTVTFDLWGASELLARLSLESHAGRRWFWFGETELSPKWFESHITEVVAAVGPRYNAELNVEVPVALRFDALGYTSAFRKRLGEVRRNYQKAFNKAVDSLKANGKVAGALETFRAAGAVLFASLSRFGDLPPLLDLTKKVLAAAHEAKEATEQMLDELNRSIPPSPNSDTQTRYSRRRALEYESYALDNFVTAIQRIDDFLSDSSAELAWRPAMLLTGDAGNGKTHLFCDLARQRIAAGLPTIVILGQQLARGDIWTQIVQRLGLGCTRDELLGALETVAEAVGGRALILLDAINEAAEIDWHTELPAMLAVVSGYKLVGIAVSCRTTYERQLVRDDLVDSRFSRVEHDGFAGRLFEALGAFCGYYGIETLNAPPLNPEFENPLFLKLFCQGLRNRGLRRPPLGHHGLQRIFSFLLESVNEKLHQPAQLDFPEDEPIVQRAIDAIADAMLTAGRYALPREHTRSLLDSILARRGAGYSKSLLRKLLDEGILAEDLEWPDSEDSPVHVVRFAYQRMADYQLGRRLLDQFLSGEMPGNAFAVDGPFARIFSGNQIHRLRGLLAALIVLAPERTGREFGELMPSLQQSSGFAQAFLESLPWREARHITPQAISFVEELLARDHSRSANYSDADAAMDRVLLLAAQPGHPLNARWLHARLLSLTMADRDVSWSTFLHRSRKARPWQKVGAIERLIEWGWQQNVDEADPCAGFDDEVATLAAITLTWCLTTSNRFVRDRATKALVCILRNRLQIIPQLLADFESVDDAYVIERLLCAVYGAVMYSNNQEQVGLVALTVYRRIFESQMPPPHVLIRDYARGILEYALFIGCPIDLDLAWTHPPYQSAPVPSGVPTWEELEARYDAPEYATLRLSLAPDWGDFARYVLGANSYEGGLHSWTDQPSPFEDYHRIDSERPTLSEGLAARWYQVSHGDLWRRLLQAYRQEHVDSEAEAVNDQRVGDLIEHDDFATLSAQYEEQVAAFRASLTPDELQLLEQHEAATEARSAAGEAARVRRHSQYLELDLACRWILMRVMELGWTPERFASFDHEVNRGNGRSAHKAERIGKKYQWLAYHELAARIFDHRPLHHDSMDGTQQYEGPWQRHLRDIDPSLLVRSVPADRTDSRWWWIPIENPLPQAERLGDREWLLDRDSVPEFAPLLSLRRPSDGSLWYPLEMSAEWMETEDVQEQSGRNYRRHLTFSLGAWLLPASKVNAFIDAVCLQEWTGADVTSIDYYEPFVGEFAWAPSFEEYSVDSRVDFDDATTADNSQIHRFDGAPTVVARTVMRYVRDGQGRDCSLTDSCSGYTPSIWLARRMKLSWGRRRFTFVGPGGEMAAYDPSYASPGPGAFIVQQESLQQFLNGSGLAVVWLLIGEKLLGADKFQTDDDHPRISVFRHVLSRSTYPTTRSRTLGYLGQTPTAY